MRKLHLLLIMLACCLSGNVRAEVYSGECGAYPYKITWELEMATGSLCFYGKGMMKDFSSSSTAPWYRYREHIKSVYYISNSTTGISNISSYAFYGCDSLKNISITGDVTSIGEYAFSGCTSLTNIDIPGSVISIDIYAFSGCSNLISIDLSKTGSNGAIPIAAHTFSGCSSLKDIKMPAKLASIGNYAFAGCSSLEGIDLPTSIYYSIGDHAFEGCKLKEIILLENIRSIGHYAFASCDSLKNVKIASSKTQLGVNVFYNCKKIPLPLLTSDGEKLIKESPQYSGHYTLSPNIRYIENRAFEGCNKITSIDIPNSVVSIGAYAFSCCHGLTSVTLPESITTIGNSAFEQCSQLQSINIPNTIESINAKTFENCTKLSHISIPESVVSIGDSAFFKCNKLEKLHIPNSVEQIGVGALDCGVVELTIPFIGVSRTSDMYPCLCIFTRNRTSSKVSYYQFSKTLKKLTLTDLHKCYDGTLGNRANDWDTSIDSIFITDLSGSITDGARKICQSAQNLYITANDDRTTLYQGIFKGLSTLRSLTLPFPGSGTKENTGSFASLFGTESYYPNMKKVGSYYIPANLNEVTISEGCEQLPTGAFKNCSMIEKLTLPTTLKGVKEEALYGCDGLTDIYVKRALPPSAYESTFTGVNQFGCTLHVPHDSKKFYSVATGWKYFYFIEEEAPLTIHVTKNIENAGEILGLEQYQPGQTAELEAIAHSGYKFAAWTEEGLTISTESKLSLTVVDSRELIAVFVPVTNENAIGVNTGKGKAVFTWEQEEGAERYVLNVYADEGKTILVHSSTFDANGTVVTRSGVNFTAEVTGLNEEESYYYDITAYAEENVVLSQYTGTFTVLANGIAVSPDSRIMCRPVRGGLCIENAAGMPVRIFNLKGQAVYSQSTGSNRNVIALPSGMYIVRISELTQKCAVH